MEKKEIIYNKWGGKVVNVSREARNERSRVQVSRMDKFEIEFLGPFKNGMKWNSKEILDPKRGIFHLVDRTKTSIHLVPEGGHIYEKISVPKRNMRIVRRVK